VRFFGGVIELHHLWGVIISEAWGKTPRRNALFFDKDVRADRPCLVEESGTARTEGFRDVDGRCTDELVFAAHRDLVCGHRRWRAKSSMVASEAFSSWVVVSIASCNF